MPSNLLRLKSGRSICLSLGPQHLAGSRALLRQQVGHPRRNRGAGGGNCRKGLAAVSFHSDPPGLPQRAGAGFPLPFPRGMRNKRGLSLSICRGPPPCADARVLPPCQSWRPPAGGRVAVASHGRLPACGRGIASLSLPWTGASSQYWIISANNPLK